MSKAVRTADTGTRINMRKARSLLDRAASAQTVFWVALRELEEELGNIGIDGSRDLEETTVEQLIAEDTGA
jgi:hypothetical protein